LVSEFYVEQRRPVADAAAVSCHDYDLLTSLHLAGELLTPAAGWLARLHFNNLLVFTSPSEFISQVSATAAAAAVVTFRVSRSLTAAADRL